MKSLLLLSISFSFVLLIVLFLSSTTTTTTTTTTHKSDTPTSEESSQLSLLKIYNYNEPKHVKGFHRPPSARSLLSLPPPKPTTALIATLDGTMYMVDRQESGSMKVIWSFSTGSPIYHSYKAPINKDNGKENASTTLISGFVECGEDWALYMHDKHFGKMRISESIAEYVARTPTFSDDGAVTLGSKRSTLFEVDAKTGRIFQIHAMADMSDFDNASDAVMLSSPDLLLKIFRTYYCLQSVDPSSGIVWWTLTVSEFEAVLTCQRTSFDAGVGYASDSGLNFAMSCPYQEIQQVFRLQKNILLEPSITQRLPGDENDMLSMLTSALMLQLQPKIDPFFRGHDDNMMLPDPMPNSLPSLQRKIDIYSNADLFPQPLMEFTTPDTRTNEWSTPLSLTLFLVFLFGLLLFYRLVFKKQGILKGQNTEAGLKTPRAKKKKARKSAKNNEDLLTQKNNDMTARLHFNQVDECVDGRSIGKLLVSDKEIAKGSNGTLSLREYMKGEQLLLNGLSRLIIM